MDHKDYEAMLLKYRDPRRKFMFHPEQVADIEQLLQHIEALTKLVGGLRGQAKGIAMTLKAITKALGFGGIVEIPFALIDSIKADDVLHVADVKRPIGDGEVGYYKQFSFLTAEEAAARDAAAKPTASVVQIHGASSIH